MRTLKTSVCRCPSAPHGRAQPIGNQGASMMALQKALEGLGSAGRAGLSVHFQNLLNFLAPRFAAQYFFNRAFMHTKLRGQGGIA